MAPNASGGKTLGVLPRELPQHQPGEVVGHHSLQDAGLNPVTSASCIAAQHRRKHTADRGLARRPRTGLHCGVRGTAAIQLPLESGHPAGLSRDNSLVPGDVTKWTLLSPSADRGINQPRVNFRELCVIDSKTLGSTGAKRFKYDVGARSQLMSLLAPFEGLKIQNSALLATIPGQPRRMAPEGIAVRSLDLDDLRPKISQDCRR
jgi:hypothetical protein